MTGHRIPLLLALVAAILGSPLTVMAAEPNDDAGTLTLYRGEAPLLQYNARYIESPKADAPWYGRSGFIHPVYTPSGRIVTDGFPSDHLHQHGVMFAWTSARIDGRRVDFWNSSSQTGRVEHADTLKADEDALAVKLHHIDDTDQPPRVVLHETWQIQAVPHPSMHVF